MFILRKLIRKSDKDLGKFGELLSALYLIMKGYKIREKNYWTKIGEIDIICQKRNTVVFVEVKTRKNTKYVSPKENIDYRKLRKIRRVAQSYIDLKCHDNHDYRIDCIEVCMDKSLPIIRHIKAIGYQIDDYK